MRRGWGDRKNGALAATIAVTLLTVFGCASQREADAPPKEPPATAFEPDADLYACPSLLVRNKPPATKSRQIIGFQPFMEPRPGVRLAIVPTTGACLTSGFGPRNGRLHKGLDLQSKPGAMVVAAGAGVVLQAKWRNDYGNMVLIDHGDGVFTRYGHLASFEPSIEPGAEIAFGAPLGVMGGTAKPRVARHLHYEVLTGDIDNPAGSFGLTPVDPFAATRFASAERD